MATFLDKKLELLLRGAMQKTKNEVSIIGVIWWTLEEYPFLIIFEADESVGLLQV